MLLQIIIIVNNFIINQDIHQIRLPQGDGNNNYITNLYMSIHNMILMSK